MDAAPDLAIGKTDGVTTVVPGQTLTYTLSVTNSGNQDAAGVLVTDVIPDHTTFISADPPATETFPGSGVITWTTIIPGGGTTATFTGDGHGG